MWQKISSAISLMVLIFDLTKSSSITKVESNIGSFEEGESYDLNCDVESPIKFCLERQETAGNTTSDYYICFNFDYDF